MPSSFSLATGGGPTLRVGVLATKTVVKIVAAKWIINGITKDYLGNALGACRLECSETVPGIAGTEPKGRLVTMTVSSSAGVYELEVHSKPGQTYQVDAYLPGAPDRAGTTVNTLQGNLKVALP